MAHEEMSTIRKLDSTLLEAHRERLHMYFAAKDDWVSSQADITRLFLPDDAPRVVEQAGVPHCILSRSQRGSCCSVFIVAH
ncbi:hypothetical protein C8R46DRAFT_207545 [Mycena filopes]|nr:hypothetical protein C8R46DRAFT_207545 [Mycena filopes]